MLDADDIGAAASSATLDSDAHFSSDDEGSKSDHLTVQSDRGHVGKERKTGRPPPREPPPQETLRLSASGAGMLLGDLEHLLMETAWKLGRPASARQLHAKVVKARGIELITVTTVLNRLVSPKRLMRREKIEDLFHYSPVLTRDEFMQRASRHVIERVLALGHEAVTASMVDVLAEKDPDLLAELGRLVRQRLRDDTKRK